MLKLVVRFTFQLARQLFRQELAQAARRLGEDIVRQAYGGQKPFTSKLKKIRLIARIWIIPYGFVVRVVDGHDPMALRAAFEELPVIQNGNRPMAIVAETVKGWGAPSEQGMGYHGKPADEPKQLTA